MTQLKITRVPIKTMRGGQFINMFLIAEQTLLEPGMIIEDNQAVIKDEHTISSNGGVIHFFLWI